MSVIVPVYNPGEDIDALIDSLLGQTMPVQEREFILVDDGSTDGTGERLDRLGDEHESVHVVHIPNSGWPGRPRNVGLDRATGEYVFFADNDDWLAPDALDLLYACAVEHGADIVIGKVVGHGRHIPHIFTRDRHGLDAGNAPLALLTPHKLFRTALLRDHGIRFPEGRRRLEDHLFVVPAYFAAERISVLAGHPVYHWALRRERSASHRQPDVEGHFESLRELLDIVDERTSPGRVRDRYYLHWYRIKLLKRIGRSSGHQEDSRHRLQFFDEARALMQDRFPPRLDDQLPFDLRLRARLARRGDLPGLERLRAFETGVRGRSRLEAVPAGGTGLGIRVAGGLVHRGRPVVRVSREAGRLVWQPPAELEGLWDASERELPSELRASVRVVFRSSSDESEWPLGMDTAVDVPAAVEGEAVPVTVQSALDVPAALAAEGRAPIPAGRYALRVAVSIEGFSHEAPVRSGAHALTVTVMPDGRIIPSHHHGRTGGGPPSPRGRILRWVARAVRPLRRAGRHWRHRSSRRAEPISRSSS